MTTKPNKTEIVIKLLRRPQGATMVQLQTATGWLPHSTRAALTGFRKKGHDITRGKNAKDVTVYKIEKAATK
jgi:hypothetical protein